MDLRATYDRIARDWVRDHSADTWWVPGTDKFLSFLEPKARILDVGCGAGVKTRYLMDKGFEVHGIDFSQEMIAIAKERVPSGKFSVMDVRQPLELDSFDGVFAQAVLLHIPKKEILEVLKNILHPLKTGGYFYAAVKEIRDGQAEEEILKENDYGYDYERLFSYYTLDELKGYLDKLGAELVYESVTPSGNTNWIQVVARIH